jgi:DNA-binding transcriptional MerR regulator
MQLYISDIAESCNVAVNTVRNWCKDYGQFLSAGASVASGKRTFTAHDLQVITYIAQLRSEGMQRDSIVQRLSETTFGDTEELEDNPDHGQSSDHPAQAQPPQALQETRNPGYSVLPEQIAQFVTRSELDVLRADFTDMRRDSRGLVLGIGIGFIAALLLVILLLLLASVYGVR